MHAEQDDGRGQGAAEGVIRGENQPGACRKPDAVVATVALLAAEGPGAWPVPHDERSHNRGDSYDGDHCGGDAPHGATLNAEDDLAELLAGFEPFVGGGSVAA